MFVGRKKEYTIWQWFSYKEMQAKCECKAITNEGRVYDLGRLFSCMLYLLFSQPLQLQQVTASDSRQRDGGSLKSKHH